MAGESSASGQSGFRNSFTGNQSDYFILGLNSLGAFVFSYLAVHLIFQVVTVLTGASFGLRTNLHYTGIIWSTSDYSRVWTHDSVITTFLSGSVILVVLSLVLFFLLFDSLYVKLSIKLLIIWLLVHAINRVAMAFILGNVFYLYSSNLVADWLYFNFTGKFLTSLIILVLLLVTGAYLAGAFLLSANSNRMLAKGSRKKLVYWIVVLPWLIGSLLISLMYLPEGPSHEIWVLLAFFPLVLSIFIRSENLNLYSIGDPDLPDDPPFIQAWLLLSSLALLLIYRLGLNWGISF